LNILLLVPAPNNISPSQRFRFEHYITLDNQQGLKFTEKSFYNSVSWGLLHKNNHLVQKAFGIFKGFVKRFFTLFTLFKYDFVFIHREVAPIGPPVFEWLIAKVFRKKIVYDFDDAIWISVASEANPGVAKLKCTWKVKNICSYSHIVSVGNDFLGDYARQYCKDVRIIPTVVNTATRHNRLKKQDEKPLTIGWTGTFTTLSYLEKIKNPLIRLREKYTFDFLVIANKDPQLTGLDYTYKHWDVNSEIDDLLKMNIGLMPLSHSETELGKCAFKAIQYMSLGIPSVVSPVGANCVVVENNITGFWADTDEEWYAHLEQLLNDELLRQEMGARSRARIVQKYSVEATAEMFFNLFKK